MHKMHRMGLFRSVKLSAWVAGLIFASAGAAHCQSTAGRSRQLDLAGTYSFIEANSRDFGGRFGVNRGSVSFTYVLNDSFAVVSDVGVYRFPELPLNTNSTM